MRNLESTRFDAIVVGSGINSLVCAAMLARSGKKVAVLERERTFGGCIRTEQLTLPGFTHDTFAAALSLFVAGPAWGALGELLVEAGIEFVKSDTPTGVMMRNGAYTWLTDAHAENVGRFDAMSSGDGAAFDSAMNDVGRDADVIFPILGNELLRFSTIWSLLRSFWKKPAKTRLQFFGESLKPCTAWLDSDFNDSRIKAMIAPWTLHAGLNPQSPTSALMGKIMMGMLESAGLPLIRGGNGKLVDALLAVVVKNGGLVSANCDVDSIITSKGGADGVTLTDGRKFHANDVVCNVTPTQLYGRLLESAHVPETVSVQAARYRYGNGNMQIHFALSRPIQWPDRMLDRAGYIHICDGAESVKKAVNEAARGMLPAEPTICIAQPCFVDSSRAPEGAATLWIQLPECPRHVLGDAAGEIQVRGDGTWTDEIKNAYADRVIAQIDALIPGFKETILARYVISPADLNSRNINLVGGDPYSGSCELDQSFLWRPLKGSKNHGTPIKHLWHIGASTHPGPGTGGASGYHVARTLGAK